MRDKLDTLLEMGDRLSDGTAQTEVAASGETPLPPCGDAEEVARQVKLAFRKLPGEMALACFAKVMTSALPNQIKVAAWKAVRFSHIWWGVDDVLHGRVMDDPVVQRAFADAVPMRRWVVENNLPGHGFASLTLRECNGIRSEVVSPWAAVAAMLAVACEDSSAAASVAAIESVRPGALAAFRDAHGNNLLWYLTYRDDQQANGGYACPKTAAALIDCGVDPFSRNDLGLCWNDVAGHFVRR